MIQSVKCVAHKCEDLGSNPQHSHEKLSVAAHTYNPSAQKIETERFPETFSTVSLDKKVSYGLRETSEIIWRMIFNTDR